MADRGISESIKLVDPVKVVEELKRREEQGFDGILIIRFRKGQGIISLREEYKSDDIPEELIEHAERGHLYGKMTFSYQNGLLKKQYIQRQIPLEDYYL